jgi:hypothetical protein
MNEPSFMFQRPISAVKPKNHNGGTALFLPSKKPLPDARVSQLVEEFKNK